MTRGPAPVPPAIPTAGVGTRRGISTWQATMQAQTWRQYVDRLHALLAGLCLTDGAGRPLGVDAGVRSWVARTLEVGRRRRSVYLVGNGASASMASHFAADLSKNARLHAQVFSDLSLITAISNDLGYDRVFAEPLGRRGQEGDLLVAISSSGRSPNILAAVEVARRLGMTTVTLSAMAPDNPLRAGGDLNAYVPADTYGAAESAHASVLHWWMDLVQAEAQAETQAASQGKEAGAADREPPQPIRSDPPHA